MNANEITSDVEYRHISQQNTQTHTNKNANTVTISQQSYTIKQKNTLSQKLPYTVYNNKCKGGQRPETTNQHKQQQKQRD